MTIPGGGKAPQVTLTDEARRRLSNQIARAYRGTYGARTGLQVLERSIARRLIRDGWSPDAISAALAKVVIDHPASQNDDERNGGVAGTRSSALVELTRECVAEVAMQLSRTPPA